MNGPEWFLIKLYLKNWIVDWIWPSWALWCWAAEKMRRNQQWGWEGAVIRKTRTMRCPRKASPEKERSTVSAIDRRGRENCSADLTAERLEESLIRACWFPSLIRCGRWENCRWRSRGGDYRQLFRSFLLYKTAKKWRIIQRGMGHEVR